MGRVTARRRASHLTASEEGSAITQRPETLVVEEPLEIRLNGTPLTVTMRTPGSDVELAQGFLLTEGVIAGRDDVLTVRYCRGEGQDVRTTKPGRGTRPGEEPDSQDGLNTYNVLDVTLAPGVPMPDVDVRRNFYTTSSCGICGKASLDAVATISRHCPGDDPTVVAAETLTAMPGQLRAAQKVFASTGGLHGAALFTADGTLLVVREDIGRHNAVDKVLGWAVEQQPNPVVRHGPSGQWAGVLRTRAEDRHGGCADHGRRVSTVVAGRRPRQSVGRDAGGVPARRLDEHLQQAGPDQALTRALSCRREPRSAPAEP